MMVKKFRVNGITCPNCAKKLESEINKLSSIKSAKLDFLKSTLELDYDNELALKDVLNLAKNIEPDAVIVINHKKTKSYRNLVDIILLVLGLFFGCLIFVIKVPAVVYWALFIASALLMGYKTYLKAFNLLIKGIVNENFLVTVSMVGATLVGEHFDGLMVVALYTLGKILEGIALNHSKKSIENLTNIKPEYAVILDKQKQEMKVLPSEIKVGDILVIRAGEKIAVDGIVVDGSVTLNTQSLTGESLPHLVRYNDEVLSGSIVLDGVLFVQATKMYKESTVNRIIDLIENGTNKKARTETVISKIAKWYSLGVVFLSILVWGIVWLVSNDFEVALYRGLIFLVVSCPCAFAISVPLAYFSGLGNASRNGILVKGSNYLDVLANINLVAFDKTGTLTTGEFEVTDIQIKKEGYSKQDVLHLAGLGEQYSNHPLAKAIVRTCTNKLEKLQVVKEVAGQGVEYVHNDIVYFVGRKKQSQRDTVVELYKQEQLLAEIYLQDTVKVTAMQTIQQLKDLKIKTVMLSGDNHEVVKRVADQIQLDEAYAKLLPEDKFNWIEKHKNTQIALAYVGDGINDAPSLTLADVGISMGLNGSSVSLEAADVILANDNPKKIITGIKISKYTRKIVWQNIILSALIKVIFLTLGVFGITGMLSAVIADVGVTLLAIINSLRALKYDANRCRTKPNKRCI